MSTYRVFLGAPSLSEIGNDPTSYSWRTFTLADAGSHSGTLSRKSSLVQKNTVHYQVESRVDMSCEDAERGEDVPVPVQRRSMKPLSVIFPTPLIEAASQRISLIYKDIRFRDSTDEDEEYVKKSLLEVEGVSDEEMPQSSKVDIVSEDVGTTSFMPNTSEAESSKIRDTHQEVEVSVFRGVEQTTLFSWPPSVIDDVSAQETDASRSGIYRRSLEAPSFLLDTQSTGAKAGRSQLQGFETQTQPESQSFGLHSSTSSIAHFPSFYFSLHALTSLSSLSAQVPRAIPGTKGKLTRKVNLVLAVLEVEGPDTIRIKKGPEAGKEVSILKLVLGDEEGSVCKLTAWRETAEEWGGCGQATGTKRGDVVYLENVMATCEPATSISISASSYLKSSLTICYRAMPITREDGQLRPDLRLGYSEPCVRKVANVVHWFERMAGLAA